MGDLFRKEAVDAQKPQWLGNTRLALPVSQKLWGLAALVITLALLALLFFGHYTRRERVSGKLVPQAGLLQVTARDAGTVAREDVVEGAEVDAGDSLFRLAVDRGSQGISHTNKVVANKLQAQQENLRASITDVTARAHSKKSQLQNHIATLGQQIQQVNSQLALQKKRLTRARKLVEHTTLLHDKGIISTVEFDKYVSDKLSQKAQVKSLRRDRLNLQAQRNKLSSQLEQLPHETGTRVHDLQGQVSQLGASRAKNALERNNVLHAVADGTVSTVQVHPGQTVAPGDTLATILPTDSSLRAQLLVPSSAIGFVHEGTPVAMHYTAFPYQKFGVQHGEVVAVSHNALDAEAAARLTGGKPPEKPVFRVKVRLEQQTIEAYGKRQKLLPGMTMNADLMLDNRRLVEWILEPLYGLTKQETGST